MNQIVSGTTTPQREAYSATGTQLGGRGLVTPANSGRAVAWLVQRSPSEVDRALRSLASSHNVALQVSYDTRQTRDIAGNVTTHFFAKSCQGSGQIEDAERVAAKIAAAMEPAPVGMIEGWLAELSVIVARKKDDEFGETLRIEAYASRLRAYPADVAKAALLGRVWRFWPSWAELADLCDSMVMERQHMLSAAYRLIKPAPPAPPEQVNNIVKLEAAAEIMESAGFTVRRMEAVKAAPMARTMDEAEHRATSARVPHWSETATQGDPRWEMLRKSRIASGLIQSMDTAQ